MKPMAAAALGALISGVGFYAVGVRAQNPFVEVPALVQPAAAPAVVSQRPVQARRVYSAAAPVQERVVYERSTPQRSWAKTAMVIGGSSAAGAGVGGLISGKKGALVGAALAGGAASIYEASRRR